MIQIIYDKSKHAVKVTGHAGCGEKGADPVCAAVSALVLTLAENVQVLGKTGTAQVLALDVKEGAAELRCQPKKGMEPVVRCIFDAVCCGFSLVQEMHPENVRYKVVL